MIQLIEDSQSLNVGRDARLVICRLFLSPVNQYIKSLLLLSSQIKGRGSSVALGGQQEAEEICFEEKCLKHLEEREGPHLVFVTSFTQVYYSDKKMIPCSPDCKIMYW